MEPARRQFRIHGRRGKRRGRGGAVLIRPLCRALTVLFLACVFLTVGRSCVHLLPSIAETAGHSLKEQISRQAVELIQEFWYPNTETVKEKKQRAGDADPSYQRYIEQQKKEEEYRRLLRVLEENSLLFQDGSSGKTKKEAAGGSAAGDGTAGLSGQPTLGTVAGEELFGEWRNGAAGEDGVRYLAEQLADYDFLMKHFYTVHPTAAAGRDLMRAADFLEKDLSLKAEESSGDAAGPQILIYHTHSQEEYADYHQGNSEATIVTVGEYLAELLEKKGYRVIHDTSVYDLKDGTLDRSKAYNYALEGVTGILQKYPSIQVVLDLHRDGVAETTRLISEVNGKQTASIMFFNGTSETPDGPIEYLPNPYRTENLAFSFQMKLCAEALYPGLTRNIYLKGLRYNQHLRPRSALIEVGAQTNTCEEALNAMEPLSELLDLVLGEGI